MLGSFYKVGEIDKIVYLGEGAATMLTIWDALDKQATIISVGSAANIPHVVKALKDKHKELEIIICMDDSEAADNAIKRIEPQYRSSCSYRRPNFANLPNPNNEELADFNDIISKCGQSLCEVRRQLSTEFKMTKTEAAAETKEDREGDFYGKLGRIIGDAAFIQKLKERNYDEFEKEHKALFSRGGLATGYEKIDEKLCFYKGDFVVIQGMSNHGKSTLMLQTATRFLKEDENQKQNPVCIYMTYESSPLAVETKFINLLGHEMNEGTVILYNRELEGKYRYPDKKGFQGAIMTKNQLLREKRIFFLCGIPFEKLSLLIDLYKLEFPDRTIVLFLDYIQIIDSETDQKGWEKIKDIAYGLEKLATKKEIIIVTGSQVNENRQAREGRDIYNAATTVIDIFNHSHEALNTHSEHKKEFKPKISNKSVCSFSVVKQKNGESFALPDYFLFNGYNFEVKGSNNANTKKIRL
jgi:hypothetical protein